MGLAAISPFEALRLLSHDATEEEVKQIFVHTASSLSSQAKNIVKDSFELPHDLDKIQGTLDRIKEIAMEETGDIPRHKVLKAL
jgi:hypothetical protein